MLKGRSRDPRTVSSPTPAHLTRPLPQQPTSRLAGVPSSSKLTLRTPTAQRAPLAKPEPDYEVVEFPSEQYVNAKLQPPPPPPPRPPTGHPAEAGASCGLCGGGGARVRCAECGRRALCASCDDMYHRHPKRRHHQRQVIQQRQARRAVSAECGRRALCVSCDDMYHRHPKRRHHQRQALTMTQMRDERPPLPPKAAAPVPPPRRHKLSSASPSPRPPSDPRSATLGPHSPAHAQNTVLHNPTVANNHMSTLPSQHAMPPHLQGKMLGSMPYLPNLHQVPPQPVQQQANAMGPLASWGRPRGSLPGFNVPPNMQMQTEAWESPENNMPAHTQSWGRPLRRGASVLELGGGMMMGAAPGCAGCASGWRYGSCASLDHAWGGWPPQPALAPPCCAHAPPPQHPHGHHAHAPYTPQPYRRADSRAVSRAASRTCSRAASPAMSTRSRTSRRTKHRTPSPPPLPSSDADSESESDGDRRPPPQGNEAATSHQAPHALPAAPLPSSDADSESESDGRRPPPQDRYPPQESREVKPQIEEPAVEEDSLGPPPAPPTAAWQCEHCTFVNEPGVRVCVVCCRTPTAAPKVVATPPSDNKSGARQPERSRREEQSITDSAKAIADTARSIARLDVNERSTASPSSTPAADTRAQNGITTRTRTISKKERVSTGCGPSPPREEQPKQSMANNRLVTPTREASVEPSRHDMAVGSSPPKELQSRIANKHEASVRASPYRESAHTPPEPPTRHSISVGPSPPREQIRRSPSIQKKSAGTSPPGEGRGERRMASTRTNVSNTGTSPPPQSISTQTYEVPSTWDRAPSRSRSRRRFRDEARRERSHSRHSLSSDTRESERSARTSGGGGASGRWEWREWREGRDRERDSSPGGEWSGSERRPRPARLARRASHLDLHRAPARNPPHRRSSFYGSEAVSPEPTRAMSLEALAGIGPAANAAAERGLELARLMETAERLGFSAAEVQAALAQSPAAPLGWLRERWPSLVAGVRAAAARLEPRARITDLEARAALARHRGAMWPAVTECVERHRRQATGPAKEMAVTGRVWGSPAGAEDDAAPPRRAEGSSDEYEGFAPTEFRDDDWMYLPLDANPKSRGAAPRDGWDPPLAGRVYDGAREAALAVDLLVQATEQAPSLDDPYLRTLLPQDAPLATENSFDGVKPHVLDFIQSENDFIEAYNALTRSTPLPVQEQESVVDSGPKRDMYDVLGNDSHSSSNHVTDAKTDTNAERPSNRFKRNTNNHQNHHRQNNKIIQQQDKIEVISAEVQQSTSAANNIINDVTARNGHRSHNESSQEIAAGIMTINEQTKQILTNSNIEINNVTVRNGHRSNNQVSQEIAEGVILINGQTNQRLPSIDMNQKDTLNTDISETQINTQITETNMIEIENYSQNEGDVTDSQTQVTKNLEVQPTVANDVVLRQIEDKTNNLNDIVGTTQRLIQQMKEEINSDINSIDTRTTSQSEADSSSNDSDISTEHESSYSESEEDTHNESSEYSDTDNEENRVSERRPTIVQRTSSEENDHFEEAMDHIEGQIEDFKHTNIEILDSIARSLQEENNIPVDSRKNETVHTKTEDQNNNLFAEVNSFEEIYAEINSSNKEIVPINKEKSPVKLENNISGHSNNVTPNMIQHETENEVVEMQEKHINLQKYEITLSTFQSSSPLKLEISGVTPNVYKGVIENIPEGEIENETKESYSSDLESTESDVSSVNELKMVSDTVHVSMNNSIQTSDETTSVVNINESESNDFNTFRMEINDTENAEVNATDVAINDHELNISNDNKIEDPNDLIIDEERNGEILKVDDEEEEEQNETNETQNNPTNVVDVEQPSEETVPKPSSMANRTLNSIKSNIPKFIKLVQSNKQKTDKNSTKVITSKVPVRRASQKQYPAPAPPKSHFGNIQSGHVKQLQSRLFNNKFPKTEVHIPTTVEVKPSTSTLHKKKPAPPPPTAQTKQMSPERRSPPKEKKDNFFRESCRTEDEWTESDSEESQIQITRSNDEPERVPSPPPPLTLRRVSGQIIDLAKVQLPEGSPERQARMLLAQGATETWEQARLAVELAARGAGAGAALLAALECADLPAALAYLHQDCELCASRLPEHEMVSMLRCTHRCCRECARHYFTVQITERSIADCVCPYCKVPELESLPEDEWLEYFAHLDILLKTLLEAEVHELFQRKLRDRTLARDPNFRWCMECSSGFFVHPKQKKIRCPECRSVSCAKCRKTWSVNHEGVSCEEFARWLEDNDPERSVAAVQQHLRENGLECPRCHFKYSLSRGGCMHFTCTQCKYEFCYGCGKPFMMGARCGLSEYCAKLGLHAHHPRNCLFYLRDKEPHQLQTLLQMNNVEFETEAADGSSTRCPVQLQRETPTGLVDGTCGGDVPPKHAGLCKNHYLEYLSRLARAHNVDPLPLLDVEDLETLVRRAALRLPPRPYGTLEGLFKRALIEIVKEKIPLD